MTDGNTGTATQCIDHLFARLGGTAEAVPPPAAPEPEAPEAPLPVIRHSGDLKAAAEWLRREKTRLDGYVKAQLERLHKEHQALIKQNYRNEQALIEKIQDQGRKEAFLAAEIRELQEQLTARMRSADETEAAWRRRQTELDETEARQAAEWESRQAQLDARAAELDELERVLAGVQDELTLRVREMVAR